MLTQEYFIAQHKFMDDYGFVGQFDQLDAQGRSTAGSFKYIDSYLTTSDGISFESRQYLHGLTHLLNKYIESRITPIGEDSQKSYHLNDLDVVKFINEYENLIQMKHEGTNPNKPRKPYEGIENRVLQEAVRITKNLNKPLVDVWADRIQNGTYTLEDLRSRTDGMKNMGSVASFKTAYMIHKAMEKAANQRSFGWKIQPWHWPRMFREYFYRKELADNIKSFNTVRREYQFPTEPTDKSDPKDKTELTESNNKEKAPEETRPTIANYSDTERYNFEELTAEYNTPMLDNVVYRSIESYREERAKAAQEQLEQEKLVREKLEQEQREKDMAPEKGNKESVSIIEAADEGLNKNTDIQKPHQEEQNKTLNKGLDTM